MNKRSLLLIVLLCLLQFGAQASVLIYELNQECSSPHWANPNYSWGNPNDICPYGTINFLGEELNISSYGQSLFTDSNNVLTGPIQVTGIAMWDADIFMVPNGYVAQGYSAGQLIDGSNAVIAPVSAVAFLLYEEFAVGDTWPAMTSPSIYYYIDANYVGFQVMRNGNVHYGWLRFGFTNGPDAPGVEVFEVGIETTPGLAVAAGAGGGFLFNGPYTIEGALYLDANANGIQDTGDLLFEESHLNIADGSSEYINLQQDNPYLYSMSAGNYSVRPYYDSLIWDITTADSYSVSLSANNPSASAIDFGFTPVGVQESISAYRNAQTSRCSSSRSTSITLSNTGNTITAASFSYTNDPLASYSFGATPDSIVGQVLYFSSDTLSYFESQTFEIFLQMPGFDQAGEQLHFGLEVFDSTGASLYNEAYTSTVTCAYDPNDITELNGYTEAGYFLPGDELEYLIRFQNTGNDTAYNVLLSDELSTMLDYGTFEPVASSHPYQAFINVNGKLEIAFNDIYLVDSLTNEPGSHGFFQFKIHATDDLSPGDVIENSVEIFFDFNPPVLTNTASNQVFDCTDLAYFDLASEECFGAEIVLEAEGVIEEYDWQLDGISVSNTNASALSLDLAGQQELTLTAANPLCTMSYSATINVLPALGTNAGVDFSVCGLTAELSALDNGLTASWSSDSDVSFGDESLPNSTLESLIYGDYELRWTQTNGNCSAEDIVSITFLEPQWLELVHDGSELSANAFFSGPFVWYLDGEVIAGAEEMNYTPLNSGTYTVEYTGFNGCVSTSNPIDVIISGLWEAEGIEVSISPNPVQAYINVKTDFKALGYYIQLHDTQGKLMRDVIIDKVEMRIGRDGLAAGVYMLQILTENGREAYTERIMIAD